MQELMSRCTRATSLRIDFDDVETSTMSETAALKLVTPECAGRLRELEIPYVSSDNLLLLTQLPALRCLALHGTNRSEPLPDSEQWRSPTALPFHLTSLKVTDRVPSSVYRGIASTSLASLLHLTISPELLVNEQAFLPKLTSLTSLEIDLDMGRVDASIFNAINLRTSVRTLRLYNDMLQRPDILLGLSQNLVFLELESMEYDSMTIYKLVTSALHPNLRMLSLSMKEWSRLERAVVEEASYKGY
ncbi:hypothetical protein BCR35DRAFT_128483 [Leucosporidium creatinivorum]|uniref:F-box domain-containing protein n=1 Tax=Leucosporidium creatinivorum TaxID=106004 RepID=A0A1Y2EWY5_9BASI|nr:hypothetical protein BCR35DRAFT_128483 [Leucosporidium creatinivorum]